MKNILTIVCCGVLASSVATAQLSFGGGGHAGVAFSSFPKAISDYYGTGFVVGGHGDLNIIKYVTVRLNLDYASFASNKTKIAEILANQNNVAASDIDFSGLNTSDFSIFVNGLGKIPIQGSPLTPYGLFGFGLNFLSASDGTVSYRGTPQPQATIKGDSSTKFGLDFGAGTDFALNRSVKLFFEFKYVLIFTENESTSYVPLVVGVTLGV